jgi:hypothetical protein
MSRAISKTNADLNLEEDIANYFAKKFRADFVALPESYKISFAALRENSLVAWVEMGLSLNPIGVGKSFQLDYDKYLKGGELSNNSGEKFILAVKWKDCYGYIELGQGEYDPTFGENMDQYEFPNERSPYIDIPNSWFTIFK